MPTGTVKFFNKEKGFGFIVPDEGGPDAFVHITALQDASPPIRELAEGDKLSYDMKAERGKQAATNLKRVS